ncbi:MAG: glycosyltransferase family 2 protein [Natronincolaceae bacterium]|jgi:glycosyltransferase involved in cell wall biosynthesis
MQNEITVSIICNTYNHENYIADAIEGFLIQKTDFNFEVLIHDDASTDRTQEIIREYELKYPDIIKPIYQKENQHSKGVKISSTYNFPRVKGKYIAICEGDDYWIDSFKLQKQIDYMQKHSECSLCVHAAYRVRPDKTKLKSPVRPSHGNRVFTTEEVILGGGGLFATNSILYPAVFKDNRPKFFKNAPVGDFPLAIYLALKGTVYYMDEFMSAYRVGVPGSWTNRMASSGIENQKEHINKIENMLNEINCYSEFKYTDAIKRKLCINRMNLMLKQGLFKEAREEFKEVYSSLDRVGKMRIFARQYFPNITRVLIKLKRRFA